jgi:hypothetical protein
MRELVDVDCPQAERIRVVMDNLSTHTPGSLYEAFLRISENRDGYFAMSRSPVSESSGHLSVAELWEPGEGYGRLFSLFSVIVKDGMDFCLRMLSPLRVIRCAL